ncbi:hypothetical protein K443DRAFT_671062 [Laccaria amethystina LaAM-08-1]|uniref:Uncharacterized protein n=1 Tax=Laccaria amethystina LaAM-08-1 TaxID=1095629 RepID=A0A0C9XXM4_9AGAR|nr:hypothetical protein K443DRAFT_671062 [Laccaria amethystina LaAM-08-1]
MGLIPYKDGMTCNHLQSPATKEKEEPSTHNIQEEIKFMLKRMYTCALSHSIILRRRVRQQNNSRVSSSA